MATLKYDGPLPVAEVVGYGHFSPGDEKQVDARTALEFDCDPCMTEGWSVTHDSGKKTHSADTEEIAASAKDESPRGPRQSRNNND